MQQQGSLCASSGNGQAADHTLSECGVTEPKLLHVSEVQSQQR